MEEGTEPLLKMVARRADSGKNSCGWLASGHIVGCHATAPTGGTFQEQRLTEQSLIVHRAREKRWCIHFKFCVTNGLWLVKNLPSAADRSVPTSAASHEFPGNNRWNVSPPTPVPTLHL